jgi:predicted MFS family arabinose efflux permease
LLWIYGVCATAGGLVGGWSADRFGLLPTLVTILAIMGIGIVAMSAGAGSLAAMLVAMAVWGMTGFAFNAPQQSRLVSMAPEAVGIVLALNASALYVGTAAGGAIGGVVVTAFGLDALGWAGGIFVAIAILALLASARPRTPQAAVR